MPTPEHARFIDRQTDLDTLTAELSGQTLLPIDTEFVRTDTYRSKLCLLQIGSARAMYCIDMIAPLDFGTLWPTITAPAALKVMHAAKQDMEVLIQRFGALPGPLFDTQIAAGLVGHPPQAGYATLVEAELGVQLDKSQTRTDWSRRPLTAAQIDYAANDVAHLPELAERLRQKLITAGRESWAREDNAALLDPSLYAVDPEHAWERLAGIGYQVAPVQARARRLAAWRERRADEANRPRQWILADQALQTLAANNPRDLAAMEALDVLPPAILRKSGEALVAEMRQADADLLANPNGFAQLARPEVTDNAELKRLGAVVQSVAKELGIAAELLATRGDLAALLRGARDGRPLRGWRREVIGERLLNAVAP